MNSIELLFNATLMYLTYLLLDKLTYPEHWAKSTQPKSASLIRKFFIMINSEEWTFSLANTLLINKFCFKMSCLWKIRFKFTTENLFLKQCALKNHAHLNKRKRKSRKEQSKKPLMPWSNGDSFMKKLIQREKEFTHWKVLLKKWGMPKRHLTTTLISWDWPNTTILTSINTNSIRLEFWEDL